MTLAVDATEDFAPRIRPEFASLSNLYFSLPGIHCVGCIGKIERALNGMEGVGSARVNLSLKRVAITAPGVTSDAIVETLAGIGFEARPLDGTVLGDSKDALGQSLLTRLAIAGFAMMNVMLLSVAVWSGAADATRDLFHLISAVIALPVVGYCAQPFFLSAGRALKVGALNMDVPISLAILLAAGMSLYETLQGGAHAYFDAALSLTFFLLIGRYLDHRTRSAARSAAKELAALEDHSAQVKHAEHWANTSVADLLVGDRILIPTGVRVPVDGTLASPDAMLDQSFLTGETTPVDTRFDEGVQAGAINLGAPFEMLATAVGEDTTLRRIAGLIATAENGRGRYTALADKAAQIYAPLVHILALAAFFVWFWISADVRYSLNVAVAVLIITCPCALGLAVPAVATAAIGKLYGLGFLVKHDTALERLAEVDTVIFDKTGTLTQPSATLNVDILGAAEKSALLALAQSSDHPVSRVVATALKDVKPGVVTEIEEVAGAGVKGVFQGEIVRFGKPAWLGEAFSGAGFKMSGRPVCQVVRSETLRPGAAEAVARLQAAGLDVQLLTGDTKAAADHVAKALKVKSVYAGISAEAKHQHLESLDREGRKVVMVGDGLNDTAALARAHASIAPASALDVTRVAADVVMLHNDLEHLPEILTTARSSGRISKQNFVIAAVYNLIAVPIALLGFATPLIAALAMSASSISVLLNAMRVRAAP